MASSIPRSTQSILDFRRKVHKGYRGPSAPLLVHCNGELEYIYSYFLCPTDQITVNKIVQLWKSWGDLVQWWILLHLWNLYTSALIPSLSDGLGRTGTFTLLDMTLNRICKGVKEIDMEAAVEHLRDQRAGMVVTKVCFTHNLPTGIIQMFDKYYKYTLDQCAENFLIFLDWSTPHFTQFPLYFRNSTRSLYQLLSKRFTTFLENFPVLGPARLLPPWINKDEELATTWALAISFHGLKLQQEPTMLQFYKSFYHQAPAHMLDQLTIVTDVV